MREHLIAWERQTQQPHPMLSGAPELPYGCEQLWRDFMALHSARASHGYGPVCITYPDIDAYARVHNCRFPAWQIEAIRRADGAYLAQYAEAHRPKK